MGLAPVILVEGPDTVGPRPAGQAYAATGTRSPTPK